MSCDLSSRRTAEKTDVQELTKVIELGVRESVGFEGG